MPEPTQSAAASPIPSAAETEPTSTDVTPVERLRATNIPVSDVPVRTTAPISDYVARHREATVVSEETQNEIQAEHVNKLKQKHEQRKAFFKWAMISISGVLLASAGFMFAYMVVKGDQTEPAVIIAWLSSGLVETLGLGYIIANYLFQQDNDDGSSRKRTGNSVGNSGS